MAGILRVVNVIPGGTAAVAGLRQGDVITELDGITAAAVGPAEMSELSLRPDGTLVRLGILRNGSQQAVLVTLKELLP